jgi:hypothetical protein
MYSFDRIDSKANIVRLSDGKIQCGHSHSLSAWSRHDYREAATTVFAETTKESTVRTLYFACKRHAGTVKANITKGSWSFHDVRLVEDVTPEQVAVDPNAYIQTLSGKFKQERIESDREIKHYQTQRVRAGWDEMRADYNSDEPIKDVVGMAVADEYGRTYVTVKGPRYGPGVTPNQARAIAADLLRMAAIAEAETMEAVKP